MLTGYSVCWLSRSLSLEFSRPIVAVAVRFAFLASFLLVITLLALLEPLCLLCLPAVHLIHLLLLALLELILALPACVLAAHFLFLLVISPLHFLALGILLPLHLVEFLFVPLLQLGIGGRVVGMPRRGRTIELAAVIFAALVRIARVRWAVSVVASAAVVESSPIVAGATVISSSMLDVAATEVP